MSTPQERLQLISDAHSKAKARIPSDLLKVESDAQKAEVLHNFFKLDVQLAKAQLEALDANGAAVEDAHSKAKKAQEDIDAAYKTAKAIAEKIRLGGKVVTSITNLVRKAKKAEA